MKSPLYSVALAGWASPLTTSYVYSQAVNLDALILDQKLGVDVVVVATNGDADSIETKLQASEDGITWIDHPSIGDVLEKQVTGAGGTYLLKSGSLTARYVRMGAKATGADVDPSSVTATLYGRKASGGAEELQSWEGAAKSKAMRASAIVETSATQSDPLDMDKLKVWKDLGVDFTFVFTLGSLTNVAVQLQASYDGGTTWINFPDGGATDTSTLTASTSRVFRTGPIIAGKFRWQWNASGTQTTSDLAITARWRFGK